MVNLVKTGIGGIIGAGIGFSIGYIIWQSKKPKAKPCPIPEVCPLCGMLLICEPLDPPHTFCHCMNESCPYTCYDIPPLWGVMPGYYTTPGAVIGGIIGVIIGSRL